MLDWLSFIQATLVEQGRMVRGVGGSCLLHASIAIRFPISISLSSRLSGGWACPSDLAALVPAVPGLWGKLALLRARGGELVVWAWVGAILRHHRRLSGQVQPLYESGTPLCPAFCTAGSDRLSAPGQSQDPRFRLAARLPAVLLATDCDRRWRFVLDACVHEWCLCQRTYVGVGQPVGLCKCVPAGSVILWESWDDPLPK